MLETLLAILENRLKGSTFAMRVRAYEALDLFGLRWKAPSPKPEKIRLHLPFLKNAMKRYGTPSFDAHPDNDRKIPLVSAAK